MRSIFSWILVLHLLHLPIPAPDLDGECRGTPIHSLCELHAWHTFILGVRPNDDIDQGPIRTDDERNSGVPGGSPFGDPAINASSSVACLNGVSFNSAPYDVPLHVSSNVMAVANSYEFRRERKVVDSASAQSVRSRLCVWCI